VKGWAVPTLEQLFSMAVTFKNKFKKGIISSWDNHQANKESVFYFMLHSSHKPLNSSEFTYIPSGVFVDSSLFNSFTLIFLFPLNKTWMKRTQMVPLFLFFKHDNWNKIICSMDEEMLENYYKRHQVYTALVWYGLAVAYDYVNGEDVCLHSYAN
jgi:hypothetical protein